jgi:enoyl-CoA hydratase/carnithine racemase
MTIRYSVENGVALLEIARPEKRNALTQPMYAALAEGLESAGADDAVNAIVITGQPGIFTAGNDLADFVAAPPVGVDIPARGFMTALMRVDKPVVAAVTGPAVGIGVTLLLHCDLVFLAAGATLSMPFVSLGLVPEFASSLLLAQRIGHARAAAALLLGDPITADEAVRLGLANAVLPAGEVLAHACAQAARFNALPPEGVQASKRLMKRAQARLVEEAIAEEFKVFYGRLGGPEAREAVVAFFEKRAPDFARVRGNG